MQGSRPWVTSAAVAACMLIAAGMIGAYAINPHRVPSLDPRERIFRIGLYRIPGASMAPTLQPGDIVMVRAGARVARSARRGDLVTFVPPHRPGQRWVKRVVGLSGESIELRDGRLFVDGVVHGESYVSAGNARMDYSRRFGPIRVPSDHVFLLGDNRDNSEDSRVWGAAPRGALHGRLLR